MTIFHFSQSSLEGVAAYAVNGLPQKCLMMFLGLLGIALLYFVALGIYNLYFHPLSSYPGPKLWCAYRIPHSVHVLRGTMIHAVAAHHIQYGPVVRIAPNELSYTNEEAWSDIYGSKPGRPQLKKDPGFALPDPETGVHGIITTPSDEDHARMRKNFDPAFSDRALREQESLMTPYFDTLMTKLREVAEKGEETDMVKWFNFCTFDIMGDLTFGFSFDTLNNEQDWIRIVSFVVKEMLLRSIPMKYPLFSWIIKMFIPKELNTVRKSHNGNSTAQLDARLASKTDRPDFMSAVLKNYNTPKGITYEELKPTISVLLVAGSETSATTLSAALYLLSTHPLIYRTLVSEIRSSFSSESEITIVSANKLKYQLAVLDETLRLFPPLPSGDFQRIVGRDGALIVGRYVPGGMKVGVKQWVAHRSAANFTDPNTFAPERWLGAEKYDGDKRRVVQPFSYGPRNCLGRNLAYAEMRVILARILWNFDFEVCEESIGWMHNVKAFTLWEKKKLMVRVKIRGA